MGQGKSKYRAGGHGVIKAGRATPTTASPGCSPEEGEDDDGCRLLPRHHKGAITDLAVAEKGEVVTCGVDQTVCLLDWQGGKVVKVWKGHTKPVNKVVCGKARGFVYSCSRDLTILQWSRSQDEPLQRFQGHDMTISAIGIHPDESRLCSGSRDCTVRVWDVATGQATLQKKISRNLVTCIKWIPGEDTFVQGSEDLTLRIWDTRQRPWGPAQTLGGYIYFPLCVDVSDDGNELLTSSKGFNSLGCEAKIWDRRMGKVVKEFLGHAQDATSCVFLPSITKSMIATASKDQTIRTWETTTLKEEAVYHDPEGSMFTGLVAIDPDETTGDDSGCGGPCLAASSFNGGLYLLGQVAIVPTNMSRPLRVGLTCLARIPPEPSADQDTAASSPPIR